MEFLAGQLAGCTPAHGAHLDTVLSLRSKVDSNGDCGGLHQER